MAISFGGLSPFSNKRTASSLNSLEKVLRLVIGYLQSIVPLLRCPLNSVHFSLTPYKLYIRINLYMPGFVTHSQLVVLRIAQFQIAQFSKSFIYLCFSKMPGKI